jgi:hypothetical protein
MSIKTKVIWATDIQAMPTGVADKLTDLISRGVTDGLSTDVDYAVYRTWTTNEAAQEWIDFLNQLTPQPTEAVIVTE